jgi:hypothetical protein
MTKKLTIDIPIGVIESTWEKVTQYIGGHLIYIYMNITHKIEEKYQAYSLEVGETLNCIFICV